jgi:hypothetical protein
VTVPVLLETFADSATAGFSVPNLNPNIGLFLFRLTLTHSSPVAASASIVSIHNPVT